MEENKVKQTLQKYISKDLDFSKLSIENIQDQIEHLSEIKKTCSSFTKELEEEVVKRLSVSLLDKRKEKPFGSISIDDKGYTITETLPKKIKWDQDQLKLIYEKLVEKNETISDYMELKFNVPEKTFTQMKTSVQSFFEKAREISYGAKKIKITKKETK